MSNLILIIILLILIGFIVYFAYKNPEIKPNEEFISSDNKIKGTCKKNKKNKKVRFNDMFDQDDINELNESDKLGSYFMEVQFHTDYRDTITAFNDIAPNQKNMFNIADLPVTQSSIESDEVSDLINEFINQLNKNVKYNVSEYRNSNTGWDEQIPERTQKSGWDKQQEELGLPKSLYCESAKRAPVRLLEISSVEKYETEKETRYTCIIVIQKLNVEDQMILKINFLKRDNYINKDRKFFNDLDDTQSSNSTILFNIIIEEIFVVGFLSNEVGTKTGDANDNFYNFKSLGKNEITDNKSIMKELIKKYKKKQKNDRKFRKALDKESQLFHEGLADASDYDSYKYTRSIIDDLSDKSIVYE